MQLQDASIQPKVFIGLNIHKKSCTVSIETDFFFHRTLYDRGCPEFIPICGANIS